MCSQLKGVRKTEEEELFVFERAEEDQLCDAVSLLQPFWSEFFAVSMGTRFLDAIPRQLLHPEFGAVVVPVTPLERLHCQVGSILQVPLEQIHKWIGPVAAQMNKCTNEKKMRLTEND